MTITQEAAQVVETLARAASQIGSTAASAKINQLIVDLLPATSAVTPESIVDAFRQDNETLQLELSSLQISARIGAENLELLRGKLEKISLLATEMLGEANGSDSEAEELRAGLRTIIDLSDDTAV